jgi:WD40 repeat protein
MNPLPKELGKPLNPPVQVNRVRFSPDGQVLAAAAFDGTVKRWNVGGKEPAELAGLQGHNGWVTALAFRGERLASADSWGRVIVWNRDVKAFDIPEAHDGWVRSVAYAGDRLVTCGKDGFVRVWSNDGKKMGEAETKADLLSLAVSPDAKFLAVGDNFGRIHVINAVSLKEQNAFELKELYLLDRIQDVGGVRCLAFNADGSRLFIGGAVPKTGGFVQATPLVVEMEWPAGKRMSQWKGASDNEGYVHDMFWHPDGFVVAATSGQPGQGKMLCWKPGEASPFHVVTKYPNCHSVDRHPTDGRLALASTNANSSGNGRVKSKDGEYSANSSPILLFEMK